MKRKRTLILLGIAIMALMVTGITYAYYSANIKKINQTQTVIKANELGLIYTGISEITAEKMIPGDEFIKTFRVENTSSVAVSYNIYMENILNEFNEDLVYTISDENGIVVEEKRLPVTNNEKSYLKTNINIEAKEVQNYTIKISYKYLENVDQSESQGKSFKATVGIDANQIKKKIICKIASTLHQGRHQGNDVTFGSLVSSTSLKPGDAFDCDVNGDGVYDANTERFYFLRNVDEQTAAFVYNTNVSKGVAKKDATTSYNTESLNTDGPLTAMKELPTPSQWTNIKLTNLTTNIKNTNGNMVKENFKYEGYAARFLNTDDIKEACGITIGAMATNELSNCLYLRENLEETSSNSGYYTDTTYQNVSVVNGPAMVVDGSYGYAKPAASGFGVRPVIHVNLKDIQKYSDFLKDEINKYKYASKDIASKLLDEKKEVVIDETNDKNIRYVGENPDNYIKLGEEMYRIIGVMNNMTLADGSTNQSLIKVIRAESIGKHIMNHTSEGVYGASEWTVSDMKTYLNDTTTAMRYINKGSGNGTTPTELIGYYKNLQSIDSKIAEVEWNLGGLHYYINDSVGKAQQFYNYEREKTTIYPVNDYNTSLDEIMVDPNKRSHPIWTGKVALFYPSDFGFAVKGDSITSREQCLKKSLANYSSCVSTNWLALADSWTLTPNWSGYNESEYRLDGWGLAIVYASILNNYWGNEYNIHPTLYLKANVKIASGSGKIEDPFILAN